MKDTFEIGDRARFCAHYAADAKDAFGKVKIGTVVDVEPHRDGIMEGPNSVLFKTIDENDSEALERARQGFRSKDINEPLDWLEVNGELVGMVEVQKFKRRPVGEIYLSNDFDFSKLVGHQVSLVIADHGNFCLLENSPLLPGDEYLGTIVAEESDSGVSSGVGKFAFRVESWDNIVAVEWNEDEKTYEIQSWHFSEPVMVKKGK